MNIFQLKKFISFPSLFLVSKRIQVIPTVCETSAHCNCMPRNCNPVGSTSPSSHPFIQLRVVSSQIHACILVCHSCCKLAFRFCKGRELEHQCACSCVRGTHWKLLAAVLLLWKSRLLAPVFVLHQWRCTSAKLLANWRLHLTGTVLLFACFFFTAMSSPGAPENTPKNSRRWNFIILIICQVNLSS